MNLRNGNAKDHELVPWKRRIQDRRQRGQSEEHSATVTLQA